MMIFLETTFAQESPHRVLNFDCSVCHSEQSWKDIEFDHNIAGFHLEGQHVGVKCVDCHQLEDFSIAQTDCNSCHLDVHQGKLGDMCNRCHSPTGWSEMNVIAVHSNTSFPLTGAHLTLDCKACHVGEVENEFSFLDTECFNCHESDFRNNPNAIHDFLKTDIHCEQCHTTSAWQPAGFKDHDRIFPIFSGSHAGAWSSCSDCHISPGDFQIFSCLTCHEHNQQDMDHKHREVSGYAYLSSACYSCHPNGRGEE
jgi:hypothetical protein